MSDDRTRQWMFQVDQERIGGIIHIGGIIRTVYTPPRSKLSKVSSGARLTMAPMAPSNARPATSGENGGMENKAEGQVSGQMMMNIKEEMIEELNDDNIIEMKG
ncbi:uncharacterized protein EAF02_008725 [Botrytis sinoallii]|uniref:uncharacterized protein n=1 Tax=Botrytis sinoallii TaxID=1463999 RepID=UPI0018FF66A0|nr:uncharacterized protein EAF02_008725 [Botrytis sinoallii]KAF7872654.1 hypothetical protein EAF02_008725 [Botrytis sinoallii]